ncbi:PhzF family phenazine biosynthesis protein [Pseudoroseomonas ludipueritiae]|uniref:PhzF family phenazine biosynthesis protein n=1 Tax=Pseudoroseomonas ludipueritiae TaxID=198093 RepID=A0ABR7RDF0_9PROT|nr:PhzF family phenazine biosynthesis protein [Pseudoroseomonas ludipueritiae]MBC9179872.1 PhzF family phenazine biosynthesis protein [Pseudoroseomonas ludipueritiae]
MPDFAFQQVDVFSSRPLKGNPVAVVNGADGLSDAQMAAFANWTNLSETTFLLRPASAEADYRLRIFTPQSELPFAGHPTLGSCHAWLASGGSPRGEEIVQECAVGLVRLRREGSRLAFQAPPLRRSGPVEPALLARIAKGIGVAPERITASNWVDNGPGWVAVMLGSRAEVLALRPDYPALSGLQLGVVAPWDAARDGTEAQFEMRAFCSDLGVPEDPVTGSLNAGLAQWMIGSGLAPTSYVASQGTALGREGRVHVEQRGGEIWVGGEAVTCISGRVTL